jgi:hypothetical protein
MDFKEDIKRWVQTDNQIRLHLEKIRALRTTRSTLADNLLSYADEQGLGTATIQISDGKLRFHETKQSAPLTLKFITRCLQECIGNEEQVNLIMTYIKEQRPVKRFPDIKRMYHKSN